MRSNDDGENCSPGEQPRSPCTAEALATQFEGLLSTVRTATSIDSATRSYLEGELHKLAAVAAKAATQQQSPTSSVEEVESKAKEYVFENDCNSCKIAALAHLQHLKMERRLCRIE